MIATDMGLYQAGLYAAGEGRELHDYRIQLRPADAERKLLPKPPEGAHRRRNGHLSNEDCAAALCKAVEAGLRARDHPRHLSKNNNTPDIALNAAAAALSQMGLRPGKDISLAVAPRGCPQHVVIS